MNATARPTRPTTPTTPSSLPQLPRRQRLGAVVASVLVSTALLSSVVAGLASAPEGASQLAERAVPAAHA